MHDNKKDNIFSEKLAKMTNFRFDEKVAEVFPDMLKRSIPGYSAIIAMIETLSAIYSQPNSNLYDLGCSLGASSKSMQLGVQADGCKIFAIDNSQAMINKCLKKITGGSGKTEIYFRCENVMDTKIKNASVVVLNFTLQFIAPELREQLMKKIYEGMVDGGVLILSEKVKFADKEVDDLLIDVYHRFKKANGYSELEISQKRTALENVLIPEAISTHKQRLINAGFKNADVWFQCFNFMSMLAIK